MTPVMTVDRATIDIQTLKTRAERNAAIPALGALRQQIFREWPYLYEGSAAYEQAYLSEFIGEPGSVLVAATNKDQIVGAATASPMAGQKMAFQQVFIDYGFDVERIFYFGESVLMPQYRGLGIGHAFFDSREAAAREYGASYSCFCAVIRASDHPLRPSQARDLTPFWQSRGYEKMDGLTGHFEWQDIDQTEETSHPMQFWMRQL